MAPDARDAFFNANSATTKKKASNSLNYSRFDSIVDSDEEEEERKKKRAAARRKQQQQPTEDEKLGELPPHLKAAYARLQMAQASGNKAATQDAMQSLETALQSMPDDFKKALEPYREKEPPPPAAAMPSSIPAGATREGVESTLKKLEAAQAGLAAMSADPSKLAEGMPKWLQSVGIAEDEITAAENAADPAHAMSELAKRAMASTLGEASMATTFGEAAAAQAARFDPSVKPFTAEEVQSAKAKAVKSASTAAKESAEMKKARESLEAQQRKLAETRATLAKQAKEVEDAKAKVQAKTADLKEAEKKKAEQGKLVDDTIEGAKADIANQAKVAMEDMKKRVEVSQCGAKQPHIAALTTHHSPLTTPALSLRSRRTFGIAATWRWDARIIRPRGSSIRRRSTYRGYLPTREPRRWATARRAY